MSVRARTHRLNLTHQRKVIILIRDYVQSIQLGFDALLQKRTESLEFLYWLEKGNNPSPRVKEIEGCVKFVGSHRFADNFRTFVKAFRSELSIKLEVDFLAVIMLCKQILSQEKVINPQSYPLPPVYQSTVSWICGLSLGTI